MLVHDISQIQLSAAHCTVKATRELYHRAVKLLPQSVDLWLSYINYVALVSMDTQEYIDVFHQARHALDEKVVLVFISFVKLIHHTVLFLTVSYSVCHQPTCSSHFQYGI